MPSLKCCPKKQAIKNLDEIIGDDFKPFGTGEPNGLRTENCIEAKPKDGKVFFIEQLLFNQGIHQLINTIVYNFRCTQQELNKNRILYGMKYQKVIITVLKY